jgi:hypothetical protein
MLVRDLKKGQLLRPKTGTIYLYQDTWVSVPAASPITDYDIATTYMWRAFHSSDNVLIAECAVYVGKSRDEIKIVGSYTSYNLLIDGKLYKFSGREIKHMECISNLGESKNEKIYANGTS